MTFPGTGPLVPQGRIAELCLAARDYVERAIGAPLDGSEDSLAFIDHYVSTVRAGEMKDEVVELVASALGAYLGELVIAHFGGAWRALGPGEGGDADLEEGPELPGGEADPANWRVELQCVPLRFSPVGMAAEALRGGEVEGYDASMSTEPALTPPLLEAMERMAPVTEEYYYSLTGRFETLSYAVEILAEIIAHRQAEQEGQPAAQN